MSTRRLIVAALLCGLAILVAFTVQMTTAASNRPSDSPVATIPLPVATTVPSGAAATPPGGQ